MARYVHAYWQNKMVECVHGHKGNTYTQPPPTSQPLEFAVFDSQERKNQELDDADRRRVACNPYAGLKLKEC